MKKRSLIIPTITIVLFFVLIVTPFSSSANALDAVYFLLSKMEKDIDGSTETVEYIIALAPNRDLTSGGTMTVTFPDLDDSNWCRTAGSLTVTAVASSSVDLTGTTWDIDAVLPNSGSALTATCSQGGIGSADTITISNIGAVFAATTYGVKLENGVGIIGTDDTAGTHTTTVQIVNGGISDASTFDIYLTDTNEDTVTITATVEEIPTISCSISSNSVDLGSLFPGGAYSTVTNTLTVSTSATTSGYYWAAYGTGDGATDAGLYKSTATTDLLASTGSTTIDLTVLNSEGFGITVSDPDAAGLATVSADFSDATTGTFGALDLLGVGAGARMILSQNGNQTSNETATVTYGGKAAAAAEAGSYSEEVKFVCGAYY